MIAAGPAVVLVVTHGWVVALSEYSQCTRALGAQSARAVAADRLP
jgi:hypothetical protein